MKDYPYDPGDGREDVSASGSRVVRGGAFNYYRDDVRCAYRDGGSRLPGRRFGVSSCCPRPLIR